MHNSAFFRSIKTWLSTKEKWFSENPEPIGSAVSFGRGNPVEPKIYEEAGHSLSGNALQWQFVTKREERITPLLEYNFLVLSSVFPSSILAR